MSNKPPIAFTAISPKGETVRGVNLSEFCKANGLSVSNMHNVLTGTRKSHKGWRKYNATDLFKLVMNA